MMDTDSSQVKTDKLWIGIEDAAIDLNSLQTWVVRPNCGAVVLFSGTTRDNSLHRQDVEHLTYEVYVEQAVVQLELIGNEIVERWPEVGRVALVHRSGVVKVSEVAVVVAVSAPHRPEAFAAAQFGIDTLKHKVPIWKKETWSGGSDWVQTC